jgi:23S rRNA (adenine2503-C2)-methyltransferase
MSGVSQLPASAAYESDPIKPDLRDLSLDELEVIVRESGERSFRARQIMGWLWDRGVESFDSMHDLPNHFRLNLKQRFNIGSIVRPHVARSRDGTRKLLIRLGDAEEIESVIIPTEGRTTLCISSQAGCAMGCGFCATARMGLHRNLAAGEILGQVIAARRELDPGETLTNYVFMGMGEPLANYPRLHRALTVMTADWGLGISPRRITVSTVGLAPAMDRLLSDFPVHLAVSLHATTDEVRDRIAPVNKRFPLHVLMDACRALPIARRRRITFEYVMLDGVNDSPDDARRLVKMLTPLRAKVNLIFFNPFPEAGFMPSSRERVEDFQAILHKGNLTATIRESRGRDIAAACGQLYAERNPAVVAQE